MRGGIPTLRMMRLNVFVQTVTAHVPELGNAHMDLLLQPFSKTINDLERI